MVRSRAARFLIAAVIVVVCAAWIEASSDPVQPRDAGFQKTDSKATRADGLEAWRRVYSVLTHPRCINCHTATDYPQQGEDRHRHFANVIRGPEGKGVPGLNCATCHQEANADSTGIPGRHNWHLAPLSMKWQDLNDKPLSSRDVCRAITDRSKNNNLDGPGLLKHHEEEPLVLWAWDPGRRTDTPRILPPLTHAEFVEATRRWVGAGTPCP